MKAIASAKTTEAISKELAAHPIIVPLRQNVTVNFTQPEAIEQAVQTNDGRVFIRITFPQVTPIERWIEPREFFFTSDALHVLASLTRAAPQSVPARPAQSEIRAMAADAIELEKALEPWRLPDGQSFRTRVGRELILELLREVNDWPSVGRTVSFQGIRAEGHLMDKTGGAPFGNGFGAWLDDPRRLVGSVVIKEIAPTWQADLQRLTFAAKATAEGRVQVHVHGNAPHIDAPKIFGVKIGGGIKIGGGAGSSIGARVPTQEHSLTGAAWLDPKTGVFEIRVIEPSDLSFKVDIGGIPGELEKLFKLSFKVPLPRDKALYSFKLPPAINESVDIPMPDEAGGGTRQIKLEATGIQTAFEPEGLRFSGRIEMPLPSL